MTIARSDVFQASTTHLHANDKVTTDDLLHLLLIASDNAAARALARVSPQGSEGFIRRMNEKASELGLETTHYADPSGLLSENVSSAYDMARLITHASQDERISSIMRTNEYTVYSGGKRPITFHSTNHLLRGGDVDVRAGKTGFISKAGYCLATRAAPAAEHAQRRGRRASARARTPAASWNRATCSTGRRAKASTLFAAKPVTPRTAAVRRERRDAGAVSAVSSVRPTRYSPAASPPRRAAASRSYRPPPSPAAARGARRTPSDTAGRRRTRRRGSGRRASRTT